MATAHRALSFDIVRILQGSCADGAIALNTRKRDANVTLMTPFGFVTSLSKAWV